MKLKDMSEWDKRAIIFAYDSVDCCYNTAVNDEDASYWDNRRKSMEELLKVIGLKIILDDKYLYPNNHFAEYDLDTKCWALIELQAPLIAKEQE